MNCKPGDMAVIVRDPSDRAFPRTAGLIVTCVHVAPRHDFALPDGFLSDGTDYEAWVIEFPHPIEVPLNIGTKRATRYAVVADAMMRPIRPGGITDEEVRELYSPKQTEHA